MRAMKLFTAVLGVVWASTAWSAAPVAGSASIVAGAVTAFALDGKARTLAKDDAVYSGDRIVTGPASYVRIGLLDGGSMVLRPNTEFAIVDFRFQPGVVESAVQLVPPKPDTPVIATALAPTLQVGGQQRVGNSAFFRLVRGGFRAVSGLVGKVNREEYAISTPVATMGIRGTTFWSVACDAVCAADPTVAGALPSGQTALGGTVSAVDQGEIVIVSNAGQTASVKASQFVLTTASGVHVTLPGLPGFLGGEQWLSTVESVVASEPVAATAAPTPLAQAALSTVPAYGTVGLTLLIGTVVLATDGEDGGDTVNTSPTTSTTSTRQQ